MTVDEALAEWLHLREATDWEARSSSLAAAVAGRLPRARPLRVVDLGTGTGSNLRYLAERLPSPQHWRLVDRSPELLRLVTDRTAAWAVPRGHAFVPHDRGFTVRGAALDCQVDTVVRDLDLPLDGSLFAGAHLITASALLDLVSPAWLRALADVCREGQALALFALTYDGRSSFTPADADDDFVRDLLNAHQLRDKGLGGPAAGPGAPDEARRAFERAGYTCVEATTAWTLGPDERRFQRELIEGLAAAAAEQQPDDARRAADWKARRLAHVQAGHSQARVGHRDLAAWLPAL